MKAKTKNKYSIILSCYITQNFSRKLFTLSAVIELSFHELSNDVNANLIRALISKKYRTMSGHWKYPSPIERQETNNRFYIGSHISEIKAHIKFALTSL